MKVNDLVITSVRDKMESRSFGIVTAIKNGSVSVCWLKKKAAIKLIVDGVQPSIDPNLAVTYSEIMLQTVGDAGVDTLRAWDYLD